MKHKILLLATLIFAISAAYSQIAPDKYYVQFTDKDNSPYSLDQPEDFLTQRALDRRAKNGVSIIENDLPVNIDYLTGVKDIGVKLLNATRWINGVTIETDNPSLLDLIAGLPYVDSISILQGKKTSIKKSFFENESKGVCFVPDYSKKSI